jgi:catechol 2,3-dioxygenase-like lactoylglutathione lyase family enzyme
VLGEAGHRREARRVLTAAKVVCFVATARPAESRRFYQGVLGLSMMEDGPFAVVFDVNGTELRVQKVQSVSPPPYTALGWQVRDIEAMARRLNEQGVALERFDGLLQDELGIWAAPGGARVAWFKDPDGNTLSLTQRGDISCRPSA